MRLRELKDIREQAGNADRIFPVVNQSGNGGHHEIADRRYLLFSEWLLSMIQAANSLCVVITLNSDKDCVKLTLSCEESLIEAEASLSFLRDCLIEYGLCGITETLTAAWDAHKENEDED